MKSLIINLKIVVLILFFAGIVTSCMDSNDDSTSSNTAETEAALIAKWRAQMKSKNIAYDSTATKIYYVIDKTKVGSGANVARGNTVIVKYTGTYMDGTIFDSSDNFTYVHKSSMRMIPGWEEGIELLNKGAKATFLIPSALAYGPTGYLSIPPYSPLFFVIEVVDIK